MNGENLAEIYLIETKIVGSNLVGQGHEKKGLKMSRNFRKLLKTNIAKMPVFRLSKIFMKTNELNPSLQDVDEKKGSY